MPFRPLSQTYPQSPHRHCKPFCFGLESLSTRDRIRKVFEIHSNAFAKSPASVLTAAAHDLCV